MTWWSTGYILCVRLLSAHEIVGSILILKRSRAFYYNSIAMPQRILDTYNNILLETWKGIGIFLSTCHYAHNQMNCTYISNVQGRDGVLHSTT